MKSEITDCFFCGTQRAAFWKGAFTGICTFLIIAIIAAMLGI